MDSLPICQPLLLQALGETPIRVSTPQSDSASCHPLHPRALERDPIRVSMGSPVVAALSLSGWSRMGQRHKQTFLQRRHTDGQQTHEKMLNIAHYQRNANQNYNEISLRISQNDYHQKIYKKYMLERV